jgi:hypothetical protein
VPGASGSDATAGGEPGTSERDRHGDDD